MKLHNDETLEKLSFFPPFLGGLSCHPPPFHFLRLSPINPPLRPNFSSVYPVFNSKDFHTRFFCLYPLNEHHPAPPFPPARVRIVVHPTPTTPPAGQKVKAQATTIFIQPKEGGPNDIVVCTAQTGASKEQNFRGLDSIPTSSGRPLKRTCLHRTSSFRGSSIELHGNG